MTIRAAAESDWPAIRAMFRAVAAAGDAFPFETDVTDADIARHWGGPTGQVYVAEDAGGVIGSYFIRPNQVGRGDHVANAGYMVAEAARGRGVARALCEHSLATARRLGFRAMQFNFVVSTNTPAIRTWEHCGFSVVGRVPGAFRHATLGYVDVLILYRELEPGPPLEQPSTADR